MTSVVFISKEKNNQIMNKRTNLLASTNVSGHYQANGNNIVKSTSVLHKYAKSIFTVLYEWKIKI